MSKSLLADFEMMKKRGDLGFSSMKVAPDFSKRSVSDIMTEEIIVRAPDKMMQLVNGFLILAWRNDLIVINIDKLGILQEETGGTLEEHFRHIELKIEQL